MTPDLLPLRADPGSARVAAVGHVDALDSDVTAREGGGRRAKASGPAAARVATVTMVCFRVAGSAYCVPVTSTRSVRLAAGLVPLPQPRPDIVGMVLGDPPLTVMAPLGVVAAESGGGHVLVISAEGTTFGLLVDEVTGLLAVPIGDVGAPPAGQDSALISGTVRAGGELLMIADPMTMVEQL